MTVQSSDDELLTTEEVAGLLRNKPSTLKYWRHRHQGPPWIHLPGSNQILYRRSDLETWMARGERRPGRRRRRNLAVPLSAAPDLER
jgi:hypothetical protein